MCVKLYCFVLFDFISCADHASFRGRPELSHLLPNALIRLVRKLWARARFLGARVIFDFARIHLLWAIPIEAWRNDYNTVRPHTSAGPMMPAGLAASTELA